VARILEILRKPLEAPCASANRCAFEVASEGGVWFLRDRSGKGPPPFPKQTPEFSADSEIEEERSARRAPPRKVCLV
jgi:hypothetical protein